MSLNAESIEKIQASNEIANDVWGDMARYAANDCAGNKDTFLESVQTMEYQYTDKYFPYEHFPQAYTRSGKPKKTFTDDKGDKVYVIPNAWTTAKSVICTAIDAGQDLLDSDGKPVGQTSVAKRARAALKPEDPFVSAMRTADLLARKIAQGEFTHEQKNQLQSKINDIYSVI